MTSLRGWGLRAAAVSLLGLGFIAGASTAGASGLGSLIAGQFVSVDASVLPAGTANYGDASCPSEVHCYVVGTASGHGIVTRTADGGRT